jgi:hypothetical protein
MLIEEVLDVCGLPLVEALVLNFGGRRITVPKRKPISVLSEFEEEARLRREFGGISLRIPRRIPVTQKDLLQSLGRGAGAIDISAYYQISTRTVYRRFTALRQG